MADTCPLLTVRRPPPVRARGHYSTSYCQSVYLLSPDDPELNYLSYVLQRRSRPELRFLYFFLYYICRAGFAAPRKIQKAILSPPLLLLHAVHIHPHTYTLHVSSLPSMLAYIRPSIHMCTLHVSSLPSITFVHTPIIEFLYDRILHISELKLNLILASKRSTIDQLSL